MVFRVLGPLAVEHEGRSLPLGGHKQRAVLALLLLHANRVVSRDVLVDGLWGGEPPRSALHSLEVYVSRLRKLVGARLQTRPAGYVLEVEPDEAGMPGALRSCLRKGGRRWALAKRQVQPKSCARRSRSGAAAPSRTLPTNLSSQVEAARFEELRLACLEERIEADLARG